MTLLCMMMLTVELCALLERTHLFNGPFSGTTRVSWYQKDKTNLDFTESRDSDWPWHQLDHMQTICTFRRDLKTALFQSSYSSP